VTIEQKLKEVREKSCYYLEKVTKAQSLGRACV
jgi:hypothetical protein